MLFEHERDWSMLILTFSVSLSCLVSLSLIYDKMVFKLQNEAIEAYIMGNTEKIEVLKNGEVVDYHYKVIPTKYD